jgi:hypothetical protein
MGAQITPASALADRRTGLGTRCKMTISKDVIPSAARNLLLNHKKADSSADGLGMTAHSEMGS